MARTQGRAGTWRQAWLIVSTVLSLNRKFTYSNESTAGTILGILVLTAVFKGSWANFLKQPRDVESGKGVKVDWHFYNFKDNSPGMPTDHPVLGNPSTKTSFSGDFRLCQIASKC